MWVGHPSGAAQLAARTQERGGYTGIKIMKFESAVEINKGENGE